MATFKTRRLLTAQGGILVPSGGIQLGTSGTNVTQILAGSVTACFLAMDNQASAAGSAAIAGVAVGDIIYLQTACTTGSAFITSASVTAANAVTFKTYNSSSGTAAASANIKLQYIAVRPG